MSIPFTHYLEYSIKSGTGVAVGVVFSRAVQILHDNFKDYAIAFPDAKSADKSTIEDPIAATPGQRLHIFADPALLEEIAKNQYLEALHDYLSTDGVRRNRGQGAFLICKRERKAVFTEATRANKIRRAARRAEARGETIDFETDKRFAPHFKTTNLPYINVASHTTGQKFSAPFSQTKVETPIIGAFDTYGFSRAGATVPFIP